MDKTEIYIKMCDCEEIQAEHEWVEGDLYSEKCHYRNGMTVVFSEFYCGDCDRELKLEKAKWLWLPHQDQLQEMLEEVVNKSHFIFRFNDFLHASYLPVTHLNAYVWFLNLVDLDADETVSMEQLWLAFVMKEKHNKVWTGEGWR